MRLLMRFMAAVLAAKLGGCVKAPPVTQIAPVKPALLEANSAEAPRVADTGQNKCTPGPDVSLDRGPFSILTWRICP